jgi:predicted deacetylase
MSAKQTPKVLVSLHDVAPFHLERIRKAEALFAKLGAPKVQYLFVPDFHGKSPVDASPEFVAWCRGPHPFAVSWWLHGYYHLDRADAAALSALSGADRLKRRFLTAGEGEFLALDAGEQRRRLEAGLARFGECFPGESPRGFVAPAWLFRPERLFPLLRALGMPFTEDHRFVYRLAGPAGSEVTQMLRSPVVTWATRTFLYKYGSLVMCPLRAWWFRREPVLRIALHPHDFDHPETVANIEKVLRYAMRSRECAFPEALDWNNA